MIYVLGTSDDSTTRYFVTTAAALSRPIDWVDLAELREGTWYIHTDGAAELRTNARRVVIPNDASVYARLIEATSDAGTSQGGRGRAMLAALSSWLELGRGRIVNRPGHMLDNGCKPLHEAMLLRAGFNVPRSLTSADPVKLLAFAAARPVVVKTISGTRADCRRVAAADLADFHPEQGPIHLQEEVEGLDVRVHVIEAQTFSVAVRSAAVDYRIAEHAEYFPFQLPSDFAEAIVSATRASGLSFAGWDFKLAKDGTFHALEVNPMPGYHLYDTTLNGAITRALVDHLGDPQ